MGRVRVHGYVGVPVLRRFRFEKEMAELRGLQKERKQQKRQNRRDVLLLEQTAERRFHSQRPEVFTCNDLAMQRPGSIVAHQVDGHGETAKTPQKLGPLVQLLDERIGKDGVHHFAALTLAHADQALWLTFEQDCIDEREDRRICADAKSQRTDGNYREGGSTPK